MRLSNFSQVMQSASSLTQRFFGSRDTSNLSLILAFVLQRFDQPVHAQLAEPVNEADELPVTSMQSPDSDISTPLMTLAELSHQAPEVLPKEEGMQVADPGSVIFGLIASNSDMASSSLIKPMPRKANVAEREDAPSDVSLNDSENSAIIIHFHKDKNDSVEGSDFNDVIFLGAGDDIVYSSLGQDTIVMGQGNDTYVLRDPNHSSLDSPDTIVDFTPSKSALEEASLIVDQAGSMGKQSSKDVSPHSGDVIDLSRVESLRGDSVQVDSFDNIDDALVFLLESALNNIVNIAFDTTNQTVAMDLDDNGSADSGLVLLGVNALTDSAFSLLSSVDIATA